MKHKAFTMIELVFVIVVVGILASLAMPRLERNGAREAAEQILSHIRYTQHLALQDDKFSETEREWYKGLWRIFFNSTTQNGETIWRYVVFYDIRGRLNFSGNPNNGIINIANDPNKPSGKLIDQFQGQSIPEAVKNKRLNLTKTYGITNIQMSNGCGANSQTLAFDNIGRPYSAVQNANRAYHKLLTTTCLITLSDKSGHVAILTVQPQTGFTRIQ